MDITAVILAAGYGKRMKSNLPKVLHKIANCSFLEIILSTLTELGVSDIRIVASNELQANKEYKTLQERFKFSTHIQKERLGTANALDTAVSKDEKNPILVLSGDSPLITTTTIREMVHDFEDNNLDILCLAFKPKNPRGYGRLVTFERDILEIVEEKDLRPDQRDIKLSNSGVYVISPSKAKYLLSKVTNNNQAKEYYLPDIVKISLNEGGRVSYITTSEKEVLGVNDNGQKAQAERVMQTRLRNKALEAGVTFIAPETVFLSFDTEFGADVVVHPFVIFSKGVKIADNSEILSFSHIDSASIGSNCKVGPYTRIRTGTVVGNDCRLGNFVEIKATKMDDCSKASYLSYRGDAKIGKSVNIGAGTVLCNFDGYSKHQTVIGDNTLIGSNSALIAPISIGSDAIVGAGSVITEDVEDKALAIARARQTNFHQKAELIKKKKGG